MKYEIDDNLDFLLDILPERVTKQVRALGSNDKLLEVILDLGRVPTARYLGREIVLSDEDVTSSEIALVVSKTGGFDGDNRAGIERTLHRISAIRNRQGAIVGLTCRVGRAVYGTIDIVSDIVKSGKSTLLLGRPGVGKTTMLREAARVLAETRRVVIVDTSNEIGGDGDISHPAVGRARRMQVENPTLQHEVMIEAVENHNPEVVVIDEIGREAEALAARTIAERGVQLIGTAHGNTLDNIMLNPTLSDLIGGIESVTLSDEEARRRGTQKTVLERRNPPTFDVLIEILEREKLNIHENVSESVDSVLRGKSVKSQIRHRTEQGLKTEEKILSNNNSVWAERNHVKTAPWEAHIETTGSGEKTQGNNYGEIQPVTVCLYGVSKDKTEKAGRRLRVPIRVTNELKEAQALITLKAHYRRRKKPIGDAELASMPIYVIRSNTQHQIEKLLSEVFAVGKYQKGVLMSKMFDVGEVDVAIDMVRSGTRHVDLKPQNAEVRRSQHTLVRQAKLVSHSYGNEPNRRVRVFRH